MVAVEVEFEQLPVDVVVLVVVVVVLVVVEVVLVVELVVVVEVMERRGWWSYFLMQGEGVRLMSVETQLANPI